jgi:uroporphyrinogen-III synthase
LETLGLSPSILKSCRLAAIGKDAEELEAIGVEVNLVPEESSPTGIVAELRKMPDIQRQKILVPVPKVVGIPEPDIIPKFINGLEELDLDISVVPTYITRCLDKKIYEVELELIRQGKVDAIAFSSTAEIEAFLKMINCPQDYAQSKIACFGPYTAANAQRLGLEVAIVGEDYSSFAGFVEAIAQFFKYKK